MQQPFLTMRRTLIVACCLLLATAGVAYAAFTSNNVRIPNNTISTASANLELSDDGEHFSRQLQGYEFANLVPGGAPSGDRPIFLRNSGSTRLDLNLLLSRPASTQAASGTVNLNVVYIVLAPANTTDRLTYSFESFSDGQPKFFGMKIEPGQVAQITLQARVADDAISDTSQQVVLEDFSMVFGASPEHV